MSISSTQNEYKKIPLRNITKEHLNHKIETFGWVVSSRKIGKKGLFLDLYAHFKTIKCCYFDSIIDSHITIWTSLRIWGMPKENFTKDGHEFEFHIDRLELVGLAPSFPINKETQAFQKLEQGHLYLRTPERMFFLRARSFLMKAFRDFFYSQDCIEITPPTLVTTQVEGGSTLFKLDYFERDAYLTQSSQLYLESVVPVAMKAFCMVSSYRAEKSHTPRHLTEYTHVEAEFADICFEDLLQFIEDMVHTISTQFYKMFSEDIKKLYGDEFIFHKFDKPFKRITYQQAIEFLNTQGYKKDTGVDFVQGDDIPDAAEVYICKEYGGDQPVFLTHFETSAKPFYMKLADDSKFTESVDLLWPGLGEVVGGSMRKQNKQELLDSMAEEGIDPKNYTFYLDLADFGAHTKGGFGLGFERIFMGLMRWKTVNMACLYPRFVTRCNP